MSKLPLRVETKVWRIKTLQEELAENPVLVSSGTQRKSHLPTNWHQPSLGGKSRHADKTAHD